MKAIHVGFQRYADKVQTPQRRLGDLAWQCIMGIQPCWFGHVCLLHFLSQLSASTPAELNVPPERLRHLPAWEPGISPGRLRGHSGLVCQQEKKQRPPTEGVGGGGPEKRHDK